MSSIVRVVHRARTDEQGMLGLALALVISTVVTVSAALLFNVATSNSSDATFRLQNSQALYAAEGGVDLAYAVIGEVTGSANLPCGSGALTKTFSTKPKNTSTSVTVTYYDTYPVTDSALSCTTVNNGSVTPAAAEIVATGTANHVNRYMDALVKLSTSLAGSVFNQALFSQSTFAGSNNPTIYGHNGNDGNVYTNGSVVCGNSFSVQGSVTAQGSFTGSNSCTVNGNVDVVGNISLANHTTIGGNIYSTGSSGCAGAGTITLANSSTVDQSAYAYCTVSLSGSASVQQTIVQNDTTLTNPPVETFPVVPEPTGTNDSGAQAAWQAMGYTVVTDNTCSGAGNIYSAITGYTSPTVVMTTCALGWSNNSSISLQTNVAIFSTGGFSTSNLTSFQSSSSTTHLLYLIVPYSVSGVATTCSGGNPGISLANHTSFASTLNVMYYTPCTMTISNNATGYGQIYAGTVSEQNNFSEYFIPMPTIAAASGGGQVNGPLTVAIAYEREVLSPPS